jgi:hypothetical protein
VYVLGGGRRRKRRRNNVAPISDSAWIKEDHTPIDDQFLGNTEVYKLTD